MSKEYEEPFDEQASLERLEALGKQDRIMAEKLMTDEDLAQKIDELYHERSKQIIPASVSVQQEHHKHTVKMIADLIRESRKGMFTEAQVIEIYREAWMKDLAPSELQQYLTERKGQA